jgi:type I restriction-modification system DNA methylase subunit
VLKKSKRGNATLLIDASVNFVHNDNKNKLTKEPQRKILDTITALRHRALRAAG